MIYDIMHMYSYLITHLSGSVLMLHFIGALGAYLAIYLVWRLFRV